MFVIAAGLTWPGSLTTCSYAAWMKGPQVTAVTGFIGSAAMPSPHLIKPAHRKARHGSALAGPVPYRATAFSFPRTSASPTPLPASFRPWTTSAAQRAALLFACSASPEPGRRPHQTAPEPDPMIALPALAASASDADAVVSHLGPTAAYPQP